MGLNTYLEMRRDEENTRLPTVVLVQALTQLTFCVREGAMLELAHCREWEPSY